MMPHGDSGAFWQDSDSDDCLENLVDKAKKIAKKKKKKKVRQRRKAKEGRQRRKAEEDAIRKAEEDAINSKINGLEEELGRKGEDIHNIQNEIQTHDKRISINEESIEDIEARMDRNEQRMQSMDTKLKTVSDIQSQLKELESMQVQHAEQYFLELKQEYREQMLIFQTKLKDVRSCVQENKKSLSHNGNSMKAYGDKILQIRHQIESEGLKSKNRDPAKLEKLQSQIKQLETERDNKQQDQMARDERLSQRELDYKKKFEELEKSNESMGKDIRDNKGRIEVQENKLEQILTQSKEEMEQISEQYSEEIDHIKRKQESLERRQEDFEEEVEGRFVQLSKDTQDFLDKCENQMMERHVAISEKLDSLHAEKREQDEKIREIKEELAELEKKDDGTDNTKLEKEISSLREDVLKEINKQAKTIAALEKTSVKKEHFDGVCEQYGDWIQANTDECEKIQEDMSKQSAELNDQMKENNAKLEDKMKGKNAKLEKEMNEKMDEFEEDMEEFLEEFPDLVEDVEQLKKHVLEISKKQVDLNKQYEDFEDKLDEEIGKSESSLKKFIAQMIKKLPRPTRIEKHTKWHLRKKRVIVFECPCNCGEQWSYKSKYFAKWFKFAFIGLKTASSLHYCTCPSYVIDKALAELKNANKGKATIPFFEDDKPPSAWVEDENLWPDDEKMLRESLLKEKGTFKFKDQNGNWICEKVKFYDKFKYNADWAWYLSDSKHHDPKILGTLQDRKEELQSVHRRNTDLEYALPVSSKKASTKPSLPKMDTQTQEAVANILLNPDVEEKLPVAEWSVDQVAEWLQSALIKGNPLDPKLIAVFVENEIDGEVIIEMEKDILKDMFAKAGHVMKAWKYVKLLKEKAEKGGDALK